jgi:hypothetical protein
LSKRKKKTGAKKGKARRVVKFPALHASLSQHGLDRKLSEIIKEMAVRLLKEPDGIPTEPAMMAALVLAGIAWSAANGEDEVEPQIQRLKQLDWEGTTPWAELRSDNPNTLIAELVKYKRDNFPNDLRRIVATEMTPEGNVRVHWTEPSKVISAPFGAAPTKVKVERATQAHPIADKLVKKMRRYARSKIVDLKAVITGKKNAEALQKTVATQEELSKYHPAHAIYIYAQNQVSVMSEQLTALKEMDRFDKLISKADDEYMPSGPPMSPLTPSFFTCWAFFDACVGVSEETIGTTTMAVGSAFGMDDELVRVIGLMQDSRMGVFKHEGVEKDKIVLRELVTDKLCKAISPAGYLGRKGELWYARVLPPPVPGMEEHVVFTTPYLLIEPGERHWLAYFNRTLPQISREEHIAAYERHMKFGPARDYWTEFVFEAYVNHRFDVIFLKGLPDVPESRPHSSVNSR